MKLIIKKVRVKNFLSVGAVPVEFEYTPGNHAVVGKVIGQDTSNGVGKTTIFIDAIIYAFKGTSIRKLNKEEMINKINGSECEVSLWCNINGINYRIERGMKPNYLRFINEDDKSQSEEVEHEERASSKEAQAQIDTALSISTTSLVNIITLNINYSKPFLQLDASDRRQIMLDVMNVSIFGKMLERARKEYNTAKQDLKVLSAELKAAQENYSTKTDTFNKLKEHRESFEKLKKEELERLSLQKEEYETKLLSVKIPTQDFKLFLEKVVEVKEKNQKILYECESEISSHKKLIDTNKRKILKLKSSPICSECNSPTTEGHAAIHITSLQDQIIVAETSIKELTEKQSTYKTQVENIKSKIKEIDNAIEKKSQLVSKVEKAKNDLENINRAIQVAENRQFQMKDVATEDDIQKALLRVDVKKRELADKDKQLLFADLARERLGDKGIKSFSIKKIVPILNKKMNEYLALFKATYTITFDSELNETLKSRRRDNFSYNNFSAGEQKRIDLALMFSLLSLARDRNSIDCNILILDEILDTSLCADGISSLMNFLKQDFRKLFPELCVYIITHKGEISEDNFNTIIRLKKENNFTKIDEIQKCETVLQV